MNTEQRVLAALRCEQPDRVPVFVYVNPHRAEAYDPSYQDVLAAAKRHADIIHDWSFPSTFHHSAVGLREETRPLANGDIERVLHTPAGPLTSVRRGDWRGGGTVKRWIAEPEDVERFLSIPYEPVRPDLSAFLQARAQSRNVWVCLIGNIQYDDLVRGSEADVERWVASAIEQGAPGGGFILSPCAYPYERILSAQGSRNLVRYLEAGRFYGKYPLSSVTTTINPRNPNE